MEGSDFSGTVAGNSKGYGSSTEDLKWEVRLGDKLVQKRGDDQDHRDVHNNSFGGSPIKVKVSHGSKLHDLTIPAEATFGDLKRIIGQETGLEPQLQRLFFRGKEKEDLEYLHMAGVKNNSKFLLMEVSEGKQGKPQEFKGSSEFTRGGAAVSEVRAEVDKLSEQVSALEAVVSGGSKVAEKEIVYLTEMLMRQLLKLDSIEAEGEGKVQRKMEVCRVQNLVEAVDSLKTRNSNPYNSSSSNTASVTTEWETFDSGVGDLNAPPPVPSSSTKTNEHWEHFD